jgi:hypothetical protein
LEYGGEKEAEGELELVKHFGKKGDLVKKNGRKYTLD